MAQTQPAPVAPAAAPAAPMPSAGGSYTRQGDALKLVEQTDPAPTGTATDPADRRPAADTTKE